MSIAELVEDGPETGALSSMGVIGHRLCWVKQRVRLRTPVARPASSGSTVKADAGQGKAFSKPIGEGGV